MWEDSEKGCSQSHDPDNLTLRNGSSPLQSPRPFYSKANLRAGMLTVTQMGNRPTAPMDPSLIPKIHSHLSKWPGKERNYLYLGYLYAQRRFPLFIHGALHASWAVHEEDKFSTRNWRLSFWDIRVESHHRSRISQHTIYSERIKTW